MNESYYKAYWRDWIRTLSIYRKWSLHVAAVAWLLSLVVYLNLIEVSAAGQYAVLFFVLGLWVVIWHFWSKKRWLKRMLQAATDDERRYVFSADEIEVSGPYSRGTLQWGAFSKLVASEHGLFLVFRKGLNIYLPDASFEDQDGKKKVMEMFERQNIWSRAATFELPALEFDVVRETGAHACYIELLNDAKTPMGFVVALLIAYFGMTREQAVKTMLEVHTREKLQMPGFDCDSATRLAAHLNGIAAAKGFPFKSRMGKGG